MVVVLPWNAKTEGAQEANPPAAEKVPLVTVAVQRIGKEVSSAFTIKVTIANTTDAPIALKGLKAVVPPVMCRQMDVSKNPQTWSDITFDHPNLGPGQQIISRVSVPAARAFDFGVLFFVSSSLEIGATVSYGLEDISQPIRQIEATAPIEWEGNMWGKFVGGLIGCCALALFLSSRKISGNPFSRPQLASFFGAFLSTFVLGVAAVIAAILFVAFLTPGSLPISFSVQDWRGGALLGLFSIPIGGWLRDKLSAKRLSK